jgi:hypothetical protein
MKNQTGARYIKREREANRDKEEVCTYHIKRESNLIRISKNVVKRVKE